MSKASDRIAFWYEQCSRYVKKRRNKMSSVFLLSLLSSANELEKSISSSPQAGQDLIQIGT